MGIRTGAVYTAVIAGGICRPLDNRCFWFQNNILEELSDYSLKILKYLVITDKDINAKIIIALLFCTWTDFGVHFNKFDYYIWDENIIIIFIYYK